MTSKPEVPATSGKSTAVTYLLAVRCPVYRSRDSNSGFRTELENLVGDAKGKGTSGSPARPKVPMRWPGADCSVVAVKRVNDRGAKGAGHPRRDRTESTGNRKNSLVSAEGGSLRWVARAVISREAYVRFCERPGVQFPGPTRRRTGNRPPYADSNLYVHNLSHSHLHNVVILSPPAGGRRNEESFFFPLRAPLRAQLAPPARGISALPFSARSLTVLRGKTQML